MLSVLARRLTIYDVGLFRPKRGQPFAAWSPLKRREEHAPLVLLPTSQELLGCEGGFDKTPFAETRRGVERYPAWDVRDTTKIPKSRADWLLSQLRIHAAASTNLMALLRTKRTYVMHAEPRDCGNVIDALHHAVGNPLSDADRRVLELVGRRELEQSQPNAEDVLAWLEDAHARAQ